MKAARLLRSKLKTWKMTSITTATRKARICPTMPGIRFAIMEENQSERRLKDEAR